MSRRRCRSAVGGRPAELGLLRAALGGVGEEVVREARAHQPRAGEGQGDATGVDGDPAPAPLLGDVGGRAAAAGRVEDEVAGVGGHQDAALDDFRVGLDDVDLVDRRSRPYCVSSQRFVSGRREVVEIANVARRMSRRRSAVRAIRVAPCPPGSSSNSPFAGKYFRPSNSTGKSSLARALACVRSGRTVNIRASVQASDAVRASRPCVMRRRVPSELNSTCIPSLRLLDRHLRRITVGGILRWSHLARIPEHDSR